MAATGKSGKEERVGKSEGDVARRDYSLEGGWIQNRHFDEEKSISSLNNKMDTKFNQL